MAHSFHTQRRVEFAETDMAGIAHFANFFRYMEEAEHQFFRSLGLRIHPGGADGDGVYGWARGGCSCEFKRPLRYEDVVDIHLSVAEKRSKSITYRFRFELEGVEVAAGTMTAVCVGRGEGDTIRAFPMPADVDAAVDVAP